MSMTQDQIKEFIDKYGISHSVLHKHLGMSSATFSHRWNKKNSPRWSDENGFTQIELHKLTDFIYKLLTDTCILISSSVAKTIIKT